jgi:hypothetical protein
VLACAGAIAPAQALDVNVVVDGGGESAAAPSAWTASPTRASRSTARTGPIGTSTRYRASPGGGAISLSRDGKGMGFGLVPAFNADQSAGVAIAGGMKCRYPRTRG